MKLLAFSLFYLTLTASIPAYSQLDLKMYECWANFDILIDCYKKVWLFPDRGCGGGGTTQSVLQVNPHWAASLTKAETHGCANGYHLSRLKYNGTYSQECIESQWGGGTTKSPGYCHREAKPNSRSCHCREDTTTKVYLIHLQTHSQKRYWGATNGGGSSVYADKPRPTFNEEIKLYDLDGGKLESGDHVRLQAPSGHYYHRPDGISDEETIFATSGFTDLDGLFLIYSEDSTNEIHSGDTIVLKAYLGRTVKVPDGNAQRILASASGSGDAKQIVTFLNKEQFGHPITQQMKVSFGLDPDNLGKDEVANDGDSFGVAEGSSARISWTAQHAIDCTLKINDTLGSQTVNGHLDLQDISDGETKVVLVCRNPTNHLIQQTGFTIFGMVPQAVGAENFVLVGTNDQYHQSASLDALADPLSSLALDSDWGSDSRVFFDFNPPQVYGLDESLISFVDDPDGASDKVKCSVLRVFPLDFEGATDSGAVQLKAGKMRCVAGNDYAVRISFEVWAGGKKIMAKDVDEGILYEVGKKSLREFIYEVRLGDEYFRFVNDTITGFIPGDGTFGNAKGALGEFMKK